MCVFICVPHPLFVWYVCVCVCLVTVKEDAIRL